MPRSKAVVLNNFAISERNKQFAVCKICYENVLQGGKNNEDFFGTSNLIDHLRKKYPHDF